MNSMARIPVDCDDVVGDVWAAPETAQDVLLYRDETGATILIWSEDPGGAAVYDTIRSEVPTDFTAGACLDTDDPDTTTTTSVTPWSMPACRHNGISLWQSCVRMN